jgi:hypothetical protein
MRSQQGGDDLMWQQERRLSGDGIGNFATE